MGSRGGGPAASAGPSAHPLHIEVVAAGRVRPSGLASWLTNAAPPRARGAVTVAVVSDARIRKLNRDYRGKDRTTDVLSFPSGEQGILGDVLIAGGVARAQAREAGHSLQTELRILALHGFLHLLGYDHERDDGQMARLERRLRRKAGLREGLIERASARVSRRCVTPRTRRGPRQGRR